MNDLSTTSLAFIGDAVYELYIRQMVAKTKRGGADVLHKHAVRFVRAESQAKAVKELLKGELNEEEVRIVKRARNQKTPNRSRSAGALEYKLATAFEALLGSLTVRGENKRAEMIMKKAVEIILQFEGGQSSHE